MTTSRHERPRATSRPLYPDIEPFHSGRLRVSPQHELYYEQSGNPDGRAVLFLHGGPGGGTSPKHRCYFDPRRYRIVLFDQRGCGRSTPHASLVDNTTWHLVEDIERLREHLGIDTWHLFGGSWGSTLALAYAERHPDRVSAMVLRGIFTFCRDEIDWFYRHGTNELFPEAHDEFIDIVPAHERGTPIAYYYRHLTSADPRMREHAARHWSLWECRVATLLPDRELVSHCADPGFTLAFARIEAHYFMHGGFLEEGQLLRDIGSIAHIPCTIVHGRYDVICPVRNAWRLHRAWPGSRLVVVEAAGHSATEPGIISALVEATDAWVDA